MTALRLVFATLILFLVSAPLSAQEWARKMFDETQHNFGTVARSAKTEYRFRFKNIYVPEVHVSGIRASCGCTTPWVTKDTLKTYEESEIVAHFNTDRFSGQRGATLTVTFDRPYFAEVQLRVDGYIRTDVVVDPGSIEFGAIEQGRTAEKQVRIAYAGRPDWKIVDIKSSNPFLKATVSEANRRGGQVSYQLAVSLAPNAPAGYLQDQLLLVTNDSRGTQVPVAVEGRVVPELVVNPSSLALGRVQPGQTVTKQLVVQGKTPFRIVRVECSHEGFEFKLDPRATEQAKTVHLIPVRFAAGAQPAKITELIRIETDLHGGATTQVEVSAQVVPTAVTAADTHR